eukprot:Gb_33557 [translate_table: standard]
MGMGQLLPYQGKTQIAELRPLLKAGTAEAQPRKTLVIVLSQGMVDEGPTSCQILQVVSPSLMVGNPCMAWGMGRHIVRALPLLGMLRGSWCLKSPRVYLGVVKQFVIMKQLLPYIKWCLDQPWHSCGLTSLGAIPHLLGKNTWGGIWRLQTLNLNNPLMEKASYTGTTAQKGSSPSTPPEMTSCRKKKSEDNSFVVDLMDHIDEFVHASMDEHKTCFQKTIKKMFGMSKAVAEKNSSSVPVESVLPLQTTTSD